MDELSNRPSIILENACQVSYTHDFRFYPFFGKTSLNRLFEYPKNDPLTQERPELPSLSFPEKIPNSQISAFLLKMEWFDASATKLMDILHPNVFENTLNAQTSMRINNNIQRLKRHTDQRAGLVQLISIMYYLIQRYDDSNDQFAAVWLKDPSLIQVADETNSETLIDLDESEDSNDVLSRGSCSSSGGFEFDSEKGNLFSDSDGSDEEPDIPDMRKSTDNRSDKREKWKKNSGKNEEDIEVEKEETDDAFPCPKFSQYPRKDCNILLGYIFNDECDICKTDRTTFEDEYGKKGKPFVFYKTKFCDHDKKKNDYSPVKHYVFYLIAKGWSRDTWLLRWRVVLHYIMYYRKYPGVKFNGQEDMKTFQIKDLSDLWMNTNRLKWTSLMKHYILELLPKTGHTRESQELFNSQKQVNPADVFTLGRIEDYLGAREAKRKLLIPYTTLLMDRRIIENWYQFWKRNLLHFDAFVSSGFPSLFPGFFDIIDDVDEHSNKIINSRNILKNTPYDHQCKYDYQYFPTMPTENYSYRNPRNGHVEELRRQIKTHLSMWESQEFTSSEESNIFDRVINIVMKEYFFCCYMMVARTEESNTSDAIREIMNHYKNANYTWYSAEHARSYQHAQTKDPMAIPIFQERAPFYRNLSPWNNYTVLVTKEMGWYHNYDTHKTQMMIRQLRMFQDCFREEYSMHVHLATTTDKNKDEPGGPGAGKSHMLEGMGNLLLPGTLKTKGYESMAARHITMYGRMNDRVYAIDEASKRDIQSKDEGGLANPLLKDIMAKGYCESSCLEFIDSDERAIVHGDNRRTKDRFLEQLCCFWFTTNFNLKAIPDQAFLDRLLLEVLTRPLKYESRPRLSKKQQSDRFPDFVRIREYAMQLAHMEIRKMNAFGAVDSPTVTVLHIIKELMNTILERHGFNINNNDRLFLRIQVTAMVECIQRVIFTSFFHPSGLYYGEDITPGKLWTLNSLFTLNLEDCVMIIYGLLSQFVDVITEYGPGMIAYIWDDKASRLGLKWAKTVVDDSMNEDIGIDYNDVPLYNRDERYQHDYNYILFPTEAKQIPEYFAKTFRDTLTRYLKKKGKGTVRLQETRDILTWIKSLLNKPVPNAKLIRRKAGSSLCVPDSVEITDEPCHGIIYMEEVPRKGLLVSTYWLLNTMAADGNLFLKDLKDMFSDILYLNQYSIGKSLPGFLDKTIPRDSWSFDLLSGKIVEDVMERYEIIPSKYRNLAKEELKSEKKELLDKYEIAYLNYDTFISEESFQEKFGVEEKISEEEADKDILKVKLYMGIDEIGQSNRLVSTTKQEKIPNIDRPNIQSISYPVYCMAIARMIIDCQRARSIVYEISQFRNNGYNSHDLDGARKELKDLIPKTTLFCWHMRLQIPVDVIQEDIVDWYLFSFSTEEGSRLLQAYKKEKPLRSLVFDIESNLRFAIHSFYNRMNKVGLGDKVVFYKNSPQSKAPLDWFKLHETFSNHGLMQYYGQEWLKTVENRTDMKMAVNKFLVSKNPHFYDSLQDVLLDLDLELESESESDLDSETIVFSNSNGLGEDDEISMMLPFNDNEELSSNEKRNTITKRKWNNQDMEMHSSEINIRNKEAKKRRVTKDTYKQRTGEPAIDRPLSVSDENSNSQPPVSKSNHTILSVSNDKMILCE